MTTETQIKVSDWFGLYGGSWPKGVLSEQSMSHPAKVSHRLASRIYQHLFERGYLQRGDCCLDCFAGIGGTAYHALHYGLNWVGVELELKFQQLAAENLANWQAQYGDYLHFGQAVVLQGDSRRLVRVLACNWHRVKPLLNDSTKNTGEENVQPKASIRRSSTESLRSAGIEPAQNSKVAQCWGEVGTPLDGTLRDTGEQSDRQEESQLQTWPDGRRNGNEAQCDRRQMRDVRQHGESEHPSQELRPLRQPTGEPTDTLRVVSYVPTQDAVLAVPKERRNSEGQQRPDRLALSQESGFDALISSPPFVGITSGHDEAFDSTAAAVPSRKNAGSLAKFYGHSDGQLGRMRDSIDGFDAAISSPPFMEAQSGGGIAVTGTPSMRKSKGAGGLSGTGGYRLDMQGNSDGQLGNSNGTDFWTASRQIVEGVYEVLKPGAAAVFICGDFRRNGKRVRFSEQWAQLCESCGFELCEWIRAWKVQRGGVQMTLDGEEEVQEVSHVSFFRRLSNRNGEAIENEDCVILRKP